MTPPRFGTDGIRARFGTEPLVEPTVRRIGVALGRELAERVARPTVLLAGDTRGSSPALARWIASGLALGGARALDLGVLPTAGVARLVPARGAAAGVVLSASHNPAEDNGIKLIDERGFKWTEEAEHELELRIDAEPEPDAGARGAPAAADPTGATEYEAALAGELEGARPLAGLRIGLDFAHGAASGFERSFEAAGAAVRAIGDEPDGSNINRGCGATHPEALAALLRAGGLDLGFAFDGDADRAILVDERGEVRDGDAMLYLWASELAARGGLEPARVVATSMSNLGLERALERHGIGVVRCDVGDRAVVETLLRDGLRLGGEQSGHLLDLRRSTTGDGLLTALMLAGIVARSGRAVSELLAGFRRYPQILLNVRVRSKPPLDTLPAVAVAARHVEQRLGADGRLVLRYSGTEPLARVMLEGPDDGTVRALAGELAAAIRAEIGAEG
jgi:phosphoglucosamine mutase